MLALLLAALAVPAGAQVRPIFEPAVAAAIAADPFYASRVLSAFELHCTALRTLPPLAAAELLRSELSPAALRGRAPLDARTASASLAAVAVLEPETFERAALVLERARPGFGLRAAEIVRRRAPGVVFERLAGLERRLRAATADGYDARGRLTRYFDLGR